MSKWLVFIFYILNVYIAYSQSKFQKDTAQINNWLKLAYKYSENNPDSFKFYISKAEQKSKEIRCFFSLAKCYLYYASYYRRIDDFKRAIIYAQTAVKINILIGEYKNLAATYSEIGEIYLINVGNYDSAIVYYNKSYKIYENLSDSLGIAATYYSVMNAYYLSKEYKHAYDIGLKLLKNDIVRSRKSFYANVITTVGASLSDMGKKKESLSYFFTAADMFKSINQNIKLSKVLNNIASSYIGIEKYDSAEYYVKQSLEIKRQLKNPKSLCITLGNYADLLIKQNKIKEAKKIATEMYQLSKVNKIADQFMYANWYMSLIKQKEKNYQQALEYMIVYHQINDSLNKIQEQKSINSLVAQLDLSVKDLSIQKLKKEKEISEALLSKREAELKSKQILLYLYIIIFAIILIFAMFLYYYLRNKNKRNKAILEKELLTYKIEALSLQINPHFIFNVLNSIQYNIKNNNYEETNKYITHFSKFLRIIFENSQLHSVSFLAEIEALKLYIELEQLRLKNKFHFSVNKLNQINLVRYQIPPFLLQPFVENSIWHGFFGSENFHDKEWIIEINLKEENDILFCELIDNGTGYKENQCESTKVLRGIGITKKRLEIYNQLNYNQIKLTVEPLVNHQIYTSGTRVLFEIPVSKTK